VNLRRDHVAGGGFVLAAAVVLAISSDLPFGTLASPGAGMLPTLIVGFLMAFGAVLFAHAGESPPLSTIVWTDLPHAVRVAAVAALAIALYTTLGFPITVGALLFVLTFIVERRPLLVSAAFSIGVTALAYALFGLLLKTPLPRGILGF
jgi:Tripartite tricarboxylate transporter TctB family